MEVTFFPENFKSEYFIQMLHIYIYQMSQKAFLRLKLLNQANILVGAQSL